MTGKGGRNLQLHGFEGIPDNDAAIIQKSGAIRNLEKGEALFREGEQDHTVYLILEGRFEVEKDMDGQKIILGRLGSGDWVGEISFIQESRHLTTVSSAVPARVLELHARNIARLDVSVQLHLLKKLNALATKRIRELNLKGIDLMGKNCSLVRYITMSLDRDRKEYSSSKVIQTILAGIPRLPTYTTNLISIVNNPHSSSSDVAGVVREDPSLAAMVLKMANSAYFNFPRKIMDLQHAITMLGLNQVSQLVISNGIMSTMPQKKEFRQLQQHSVTLSYVASEVSRLCRGKRELAETLGLLHDTGQSVILLLKNKYPQMDMFFDQLDQAMLGSMLFTHWKLPQEFCDMIMYQDYFFFAPPQEVPKPYRNIITIVAVSHVVLDVLTGTYRKSRHPVFYKEYCQAAGLDINDPAELALNHVFPALAGKKRGVPSWIKDLVEKVEAREGHASG